MKNRIELSDTFQSAVIKMAEGNPGAVIAMLELYQHSEKIDPQSVLGGLGKIMALDTYKIYGSSIYILWSDKCNRDTRKFILLLRAVQLGFYSERDLQTMAADQRYKFNLTPEKWEELERGVCGEVEKFQKQEEKTNDHTKTVNRI